MTSAWNMYSSSSSDDEEEEEEVPPPSHYVAQVQEHLTPFEPFQRNQGYFLSNLAKLLDEGEKIHMDEYIRWHPEEPHTLQINWPGFIEHYPVIHDVLVAYKMVRANNSVVSARASWNRKLREWNFKMTSPADMRWTSYTYCDEQFYPRCNYFTLPNRRRQNTRRQ